MNFRWVKIGLVAAILAAIGGLPGRGQVTPSAPQSSSASDGADGPGFVRVTSSLKGGTGGYVDVTAYASCRYVTTDAGGDPSANGEVIPVAHLADWQAWISRAKPAGDSSTVCCRPSTDMLCQGASGGTVVAPVLGSGGKAAGGYQIVNGAGFATATCQNGTYGTYVDTRAYVCQPTGSGAAQDGRWVQKGLDSDNCQPNAFTSPCNAACPGGAGVTVTYNSCGQVQSEAVCTTTCAPQAPPCDPLGIGWFNGNQDPQCFGYLPQTPAGQTATAYSSYNFVVLCWGSYTSGSIQVACDNTGNWSLPQDGSMPSGSCACLTPNGTPDPTCAAFNNASWIPCQPTGSASPPPGSPAPPPTCGPCSQSTGQKTCSDGSVEQCTLVTESDTCNAYSYNPCGCNCGGCMARAAVPRRGEWL